MQLILLMSYLLVVISCRPPGATLYFEDSTAIDNEENDILEHNSMMQNLIAELEQGNIQQIMPKSEFKADIQDSDIMIKFLADYGQRTPYGFGAPYRPGK